MNKLLVPIDFSSCSKNALTNAIQIAKRMNMGVILCHSIVVPIGLGEGMPAGNIGYDFEDLESGSRSRMQQLASEFSELDKIPHTTVIQYGSLHENILELSEQEKIALIVMGTHGASGIAKSLIGSNAYRVIKHLTIPVIALPENADISRMKHVALAGDYLNIPAHDSLQLVTDLIRAFLAHLHIIHIDNVDVMEKGQIDIAKRMAKYLKHVKHSFHFRKSDDVEEGILKFANEMNIELVAMLAKHHGFLERLKHSSHTKKMIMDIPMPIMVIHE